MSQPNPNFVMEDFSIYCDSNLLFNQEEISRYCPGGYHPVCLGDTFKDDRYKIFHKLGWGGYSTVWLARDRKREQWVSIKIKTADSSKQSRELLNLQTLASNCQGNLSSKYIVQLLDHFFHQGPNGTHQCLVFELLGPTVDAVVEDIHEGGDALEPETILKLSKQLLQAITFMHEVDYTHGDLSGRNVAFTFTSLAQLTEEELFEVLGPPESEELTRRDGKPLDNGVPSQLVKAVGWDNWINEDEEDIRIFDLGEAFLKGAEPEKLAQPPHLRAPETIFMDSCDSRHDLWRAGIMIYTFLFGSLPFQYWYDDVLVAQMINFVEEFPMEWEQKWEDMRLRSGREYSLVDEKPVRSKLQQKFDNRIHDLTLKPLLPVIQGLMRFMPSHRISASQALDMIGSRPSEADIVDEEKVINNTSDLGRQLFSRTRTRVESSLLGSAL